MYNNLVSAVGGLEFQCLLGPVQQQDLPVAAKAAKTRVCKQQRDRETRPLPSRGAGASLPRPKSDRSNLSLVTIIYWSANLSFHLLCRVLHPWPHPFSLLGRAPHPNPHLRPGSESLSVEPRWGGGAHPFIWRWTAWCCGSWPVKARWGWTWPGSSGLGWSAAPAIGGNVSSRLSAPVRQVNDHCQRPLWFLTICFYYLFYISCLKY